MATKTIEQFQAYLADRLSGVGAHEAQVKNGLSHAQAEFYWLRNATLEQGGMKELVGSEPATGESVAKLRKAGESWGRIAVLINKPEGSTRKLFAESTGTKSQGNRIGRGGRFLYSDAGQPLYEAELKATGTTIKVTEKGLDGALSAADQQKQLLHDEAARATAWKTYFGGKAQPKNIADAVIAIRSAQKEAGAAKRTARKAKA